MTPFISLIMNIIFTILLILMVIVFICFVLGMTKIIVDFIKEKNNVR